MMKQTIWTFDLPVTNEMDRAEYATLVHVIEKLEFNGAIDCQSIKSDTFRITIETVEAQ